MENDICKQIKNALNERSHSHKWTCRHGKGTSHGWLRISAVPKYCTYHFRPINGDWQNCEEYNDPLKPYGNMGKADREELARLLGLERVHCQGEQVPASSAYYEEYLCRAQGKQPTRYGEQYWD
jgi:hypothetical protein